MRNLAGETTAHANAYIEDELNEASIPAMARVEPVKGEVPYTVFGEYKDFILTRAWYYWVVKGPVPLDLAWELYTDPRGNKDVRVAGHCGCPDPTGYTSSVDGVECVTEYHIDTQDGLNLFAEKVFGTRPLPPTDEEKEAAKQIARDNRFGTVIKEDGFTETDYLAAAEEVRAIRSGLSDLRSRLHDLGRGVDKGMIPTDSLAETVAGSLTTAIMALYELENPADPRSFAQRGQRVKEMWEDLHANPTKYVLTNEGETDGHRTA